jgi:hypothetical protein
LTCPIIPAHIGRQSGGSQRIFSCRSCRRVLNTVGNLGILYKNQGKLGEAEKMYERALQGYEKALGSEHTSTNLSFR